MRSALQWSAASSITLCLLQACGAGSTSNGGSTGGVCGPAAGASRLTAPESGLCSSGTASAVTGVGPWSWTCTGTGSGATASCSSPAATPRLLPAGYLHTAGNQIVGPDGTPVKLVGAVWAGADSGKAIPNGLWGHSYGSILDAAKAMGFNVIRLTWSDDALTASPPAGLVNLTVNPDLAGLTALEVWDRIIAYGGSIGLKFTLSRMWEDAVVHPHSHLPYTATGTYGKDRVRDDLVTVASRYRGNAAVIGIELWNEINDGASRWGNGDPATDLQLIAQEWGNAVLAANPDVLVLVQGMQTYNTFGKLHQSDLSMVASMPVVLGDPRKLVYTFHDYPQYQPTVAFTTSYFLTQFGDAFNSGHPVWCSEMGVSTNQLGTPYEDEYRALLAFLAGSSADLTIPTGGQPIGWIAWALDVAADFSSDPFPLLQPNWSTPNAAEYDPLVPYLFY